MAIKRISVNNFKSFKVLEADLSNFNILIGSNASGKSNFIRIFEFIRDISNHGLENAISMQGGVEYLRNINIELTEGFVLEIVSVPDKNYGRVISKKGKETYGMGLNESTYRFALEFKKNGQDFEVVEDLITMKCTFAVLEKDDRKKFKVKRELGDGVIYISNTKGKIEVTSDFKLPTGQKISKGDVYPPFLDDELPPKTLLLDQAPFLFQPAIDEAGEIMIYDFDPKLPQKAVPITGKMDLVEDGANLAIVLKNLLRNEENERKLSNLMKDLLPFVNKLDVDNFADKSLLLKIEEVYSKEKYLPAPLLSDGTINMIALVIALYFEDKPLTIIEEPERNIHPSLIPIIIEMMKEASQNKQIIITTHNPEFVRYADLNTIMLISRDKDGFSNISRPAEKEEIKKFLENDIGIEELYVQNLMGA